MVAHGTELSAQFVIEPWLSAKGEPELVRPYIQAWLGQHGDELTAQYVMAAWLNAQADPEQVRPFIGSWAKKHGTDFTADYVLRAWLEATGEPDEIAPPLFDWLNKYRDKPEAVYLAKPISMLPSLPHQAVIDISIWAGKFYQEVDALWRLSRIGKKLHNEPAEVAAAFVENSAKVLAHHVAMKSEKLNFIANIVGNLSGQYENSRCGPEVLDPCAAAIASRRYFNRESYYVASLGMETCLPLMLRTGRLGIESHLDAIGDVIDFMFTRCRDPELTIGMINQLMIEFPHPIWMRSVAGR